MTSDNTALSREPEIDRAEDNAFFPSPYSLSQYTSAKTDFDATIDREPYRGGRWKVLVVATEERYMLMQNNKMFSTGNHPVESLLPLYHVLEAGFAVEVATLTGAPAKFEWWAFPRQDEAVGLAWNRLMPKLKQPKRLSDVVDGELGPDSDYLAVFIPGGHGALLGLPMSEDMRDLLDWGMDQQRILVSLCHGPAAFLASSIGKNRSPFAGYEMCVFPDALDAGANIDIGYLPGEMPWLLAAALERHGVTVINDDMSGAVTRDRNVLTGDSPLASNELGKMAAGALLDAVQSE